MEHGPMKSLHSAPCISSTKACRDNLRVLYTVTHASHLPRPTGTISTLCSRHPSTKAHWDNVYPKLDVSHLPKPTGTISTLCPMHPIYQGPQGQCLLSVPGIHLPTPTGTMSTLNLMYPIYQSPQGQSLHCALCIPSTKAHRDNVYSLFQASIYQRPLGQCLP